MGARPSAGGLQVCLCLLLGAAPAAAKDVYTLALPTYLKGCAPASHSAAALRHRLPELASRAACRFWHVSVLDSLAHEQSAGHLEFEQDPSDRDAMIADYCEKPTESSRRRIREPEGDDAPPEQCKEGYLLVGRVRVKLMSPTAGLVEFAPTGSEASDEMFEFKFDPNLNMLHTAQGAVSEAAQALGFSAFQSTIVAANHLQLTGFGMDGDAPIMTTLSAKKGVASAYSGHIFRSSLSVSFCASVFVSVSVSLLNTVEQVRTRRRLSRSGARPHWSSSSSSGRSSCGKNTARALTT